MKLPWNPPCLALGSPPTTPPAKLPEVNFDSQGLTTAESERRLKDFGANETFAARPSLLVTFCRKFIGPSEIILEVAAIYFFAVPPRNWINGLIVICLLLVNAFLSTSEQYRANRALETLKHRLQIMSRVLRDASWTLLPARVLVPGDVVRVRQGDVVPADLKLIEGEVEVDQSALTGESALLTKTALSEVYAGSIVRRGECSAFVTKTAAHTLFGKTIELVSTSAPVMHVQVFITRVTWSLAGSVASILIIALIVQAALHASVLDIVPIVVVLLAFSVPVALPAMFTVTMALGSHELSERGVLVTRLEALEDAAEMSVLCSDKTGTLTRNQLTVVSTETFGTWTPAQILRYAARCSKTENSDPIDIAITEAAKALPPDSATSPDSDYQQFTEVEFIPFDATRRRTEVTLNGPGEPPAVLKIVKGSVAVTLDLCKATQEERAKVREVVDRWASEGTRALAVALALPENPDHDYRLAGMLALADPPREDSARVIKELHDLGVRVIMVTGDELKVATKVATEVGLGTKIISLRDFKRSINSTSLEEASMSHAGKTPTPTGGSPAAGLANGPSATSVGASRDDPDSKQLALVAQHLVTDSTVSGYAEIFPEDKHLIIRLLQKEGHIVGMTGDGVNDAPALKQAEMGVAVANATDVAKSAASAVLVKEGLSGAIEMIKIGREVHQRIVTYVINKMTKTIHMVLVAVIMYFVLKEFVIDATKMLILLFLIDFVTVSISADTSRHHNRPEEWQIPRIIMIAVTVSFCAIAETLGLLYFGFNYLGISGNLPAIYTFTFDAFFFFGILNVFVARERRFFFSSRPGWALLIVVPIDITIVILFSILGVEAFSIEALPAGTVFIVLAWVIVSTMINDLFKVAVYEVFDLCDRRRHRPTPNTSPA